MKGIIYIMTTAVDGLIKIGKTGAKSYDERMRFLEKNGYGNVAGLRRFFAIEVEDYDDKEALIHEIFSKHQVGDSELFALDYELAQQLLLAFDGKIFYPKNTNKEKEFDEVTDSRKKGKAFTFYNKGIANGSEITFLKDENIKAVVCGEKEVEFEGEVFKLSPLAREIYTRRGEANLSGAYQGAAHWKFNDKILKDLPDVKG